MSQVTVPPTIEEVTSEYTVLSYAMPRGVKILPETLKLTGLPPGWCVDRVCTSHTIEPKNSA